MISDRTLEECWSTLQRVSDHVEIIYVFSFVCFSIISFWPNFRYCHALFVLVSFLLCIVFHSQQNLIYLHDFPFHWLNWLNLEEFRYWTTTSSFCTLRDKSDHWTTLKCFIMLIASMRIFPSGRIYSIAFLKFQLFLGWFVC